VSGAKPVYLTCGFVIEEGFPISDLKTIVYDMASEARKTEVSIIAGDTKVFERGRVCDLLGFDPLYLANEGKAIISLPIRKKTRC
jgi:hydrogenase maturation factor